MLSKGPWDSEEEPGLLGLDEGPLSSMSFWSCFNPFHEIF
jgi:hypothetical protein